MVRLFWVVDVLGLVAFLPFSEEVESGHDKEDPADGHLQEFPACLEVIKDPPSGQDPKDEERRRRAMYFQSAWRR